MQCCNSVKSVLLKVKKFDPGRTRTCNLLSRNQTPYPLGHRTFYNRTSCVANMVIKLAFHLSQPCNQCCNPDLRISMFVAMFLRDFLANPHGTSTGKLSTMLLHLKTCFQTNALKTFELTCQWNKMSSSTNKDCYMPKVLIATCFDEIYQRHWFYETYELV